MRVEFKDGKIICTAYEWNNLTKEETKFLSDCHHEFVFWELISGVLVYHMSEGVGGIRTDSNCLSRMLQLAETHEIPVSQEVIDFVKDINQKYENMRKKEEFFREVQRKREMWELKRKNGCEYCPFCEEWNYEDHIFKCNFSNDLLKGKYSEYYTVEEGMAIFHTTGIPNNHCQYYFGEKEF